MDEVEGRKKERTLEMDPNDDLYNAFLSPPSVRAMSRYHCKSHFQSQGRT